MTDERGARCPGCGEAVDHAAASCASCGLELGGEEARALDDLAGRLGSIDRELAGLSAARQAVAAELDARRRATVSAAPPPPPWEPPPSWMRQVARERDRSVRDRSVRDRSESTDDGVKSLLLWLGAALIALAALTFTVVTWTHLGDAGRFALLMGVTVASTALVIVLRTRLPTTADAFAGLAIALAVIDWYALRRGGVGHSVSAATWWSWGTALIGGFAFALARLGRPGPAGAAMAALLPASAVLLVDVVADAPWSGALGLALVAAAVAAALAAVRARDGRSLVATILRVEASVVWLSAAVCCIGAVADADTLGQAFTAAFVVLSLGLAPAISVILTRDRAVRDGLVGLTALAEATVVGALVTLAVGSIGPQGLLAWSALIGAVAVALAPSARSALVRRATAVAGAAAIVPGVVWAGSAALVAIAGPLAWLGGSWTGDLGAEAGRAVNGPNGTDLWTTGWPAVGVLVVTAAAVVLATTGGRRRHPFASRSTAAPWAIALAAPAACLAPVVGGVPVYVACAVCVTASLGLTLAAAFVDRTSPRLAVAVLALAAVPAAPAVGWAAVDERATIVALAASVLIFAAATAVARSATVVTAAAAAFTVGVTAFAGLATAAADASAAAAGFAAVATAGSLLVAAVHLRPHRVEGLAAERAAVAGLLAGLVAAGASASWLAGAFTVTVVLLMVASLRRDRTVAYGAGAGAAVLGATWSWLGAAGVSVVEAYTLPAALVALVAGIAAGRNGPARSWVWLAPAITLGLAPTLAVGIGRDDEARIVAAALAAVVVVLIGAWRRLQAPLAIGAAALVVIAIDALGPAAVRLPRWAVLATAGVALVWVGATFERRRESARRATHALLQYG